MIRQQLVLLEGIVALVLFYAVQLVGGLVLTLRADGEEIGVSGGVRVMGLAFAAVLGWALLRRRSLAWAGTGVPRCIGYYGLFLLAWIPLFMVAYPRILVAAGIDFPPQEVLRFIVLEPAGGDLYLAVFTACLLGPVAEEVLFRGFLHRLVAEFSSERFAVIVTSVLFGLVHGLLYAVPLAMLGLCFAWARVRSGALLAPILLHILHNTWTVVLARSWPEVLDLLYKS